MPLHHPRPVVRALRHPYVAMAIIAAAIAFPSSLSAQGSTASGSAADREAVRQAVLDYVEGFYEGDSVKLARSVRPEVYKYGFFKDRDSTRYRGMQMTWPAFFNYARGIKANNRQAPATAPKTIEIYDVQDQTASVKLTAFWGTDYMLLGKYDGKWMISHVLWQGPLPTRASPSGGGAGGGGSGPDASDGEESAVEPFENDLFATSNVYRGTFAPDGRTFLFFRKVSSEPNAEDYRILESRFVNGQWTRPARVSLGGEYSDLYPTVSPDGRRLVFSSYRPVPGDTSSKPNAHLWYADRVGAGWGAPVYMAKASFVGHYNSAPQFLADGSIYWSVTTPDWRTQRNYVSRWDGREYTAPEEFVAAQRWKNWRPDVHVWNMRLGPDGSFGFVEVSRLDANRRRGPVDLYVTVRRGDSWTEPQPLGGGVNTPAATENFPVVSPDGKYVYFVRDFAGFYRAKLARVMPDVGR